MVITANQNIEQGPNETVTYCADFTNKLRADETFTGTPTVTESTSTMTLANKTLVTTPFVDPLGATVNSGKGILFTASGAALDAAGGDVLYVVTAKATTTTGDVREMRCRITATTK